MYDGEGNLLKFNFFGYEKIKWFIIGCLRKKEDYILL